MAEQARCPVTELLADQCGHCRLPAGSAARTRATFSPPALITTVAAGYSSCSACDERVDPGDTIAKVDGVWIHIECAEE